VTSAILAPAVPSSSPLRLRVFRRICPSSYGGRADRPPRDPSRDACQNAWSALGLERTGGWCAPGPRGAGLSTLLANRGPLMAVAGSSLLCKNSAHCNYGNDCRGYGDGEFRARSAPADYARGYKLRPPLVAQHNSVQPALPLQNCPCCAHGMVSSFGHATGMAVGAAGPPAHKTGRLLLEGRVLRHGRPSPRTSPSPAFPWGRSDQPLPRGYGLARERDYELAPILWWSRRLFGTIMNEKVAAAARRPHSRRARSVPGLRCFAVWPRSRSRVARPVLHGSDLASTWDSHRTMTAGDSSAV